MRVRISISVVEGEIVYQRETTVHTFEETDPDRRPGEWKELMIRGSELITRGTCSDEDLLGIIRQRIERSRHLIPLEST